MVFDAIMSALRNERVQMHLQCASRNRWIDLASRYEKFGAEQNAHAAKKRALDMVDDGKKPRFVARVFEGECNIVFESSSTTRDAASIDIWAECGLTEAERLDLYFFGRFDFPDEGYYAEIEVVDV